MIFISHSLKDVQKASKINDIFLKNSMNTWFVVTCSNHVGRTIPFLDIIQFFNNLVFISCFILI